MLKKILPLLIFFFLVSCSKKVTFPISNIVPTANITVKKDKDKYDNYTLEVEAENMASPERINPPGKYYTVWVKTNKDNLQNVGNFKVKNGKNSSLKTSTPFDFNEVVITVEQESNAVHPSGVIVGKASI